MPTPARLTSGTRATVGRALVVEDDAAIREALCDVLQEAGYAVRCAANGVEALDVLATGVISIVVLDLHMAVMDGYELRRRQLEDPALAAVPVIMVTADPTAHIDGVPLLRKPFDAARLLEIITSLQANARSAEARTRAPTRRRGAAVATATAPKRAAALSPRPTVQVVIDCAAVPTKNEGAERVPLGQFETFLVAKIDGRRTIADLAALLTLTEPEVASMVRRLVALGVLALDEENPDVDRLDDGWESPGMQPTRRPPKRT